MNISPEALLRERLADLQAKKIVAKREMDHARSVANHATRGYETFEYYVLEYEQALRKLEELRDAVPVKEVEPTPDGRPEGTIS